MFVVIKVLVAITTTYDNVSVIFAPPTKVELFVPQVPLVFVSITLISRPLISTDLEFAAEYALKLLAPPRYPPDGASLPLIVKAVRDRLYVFNGSKTNGR